MKFFIILTICAVAIYTEEIEDFQRYQTECMVENGMNITKIYENTTLEDGNCYFACVYKKVGVMKEDGTFDAAVIQAKIPKPYPGESFQKKLDEVIHRHCHDKAGNQCNLAACVFQITEKQWMS